MIRVPACARVSAWVWVDGCEVRPCDPCARVRPCVPCVPCVSRLPPVSFYRYCLVSCSFVFRLTCFFTCMMKRPKVVTHVLGARARGILGAMRDSRELDLT